MKGTALRLAAGVLALLALAAGAQEPRKFAALSIIGDRLAVVSHVADTGTRVDRNRVDYLDMPPRALDNAVLGAVNAAIKRSVPGSEVMMLGATPPLFGAQGEGIEDPDVKPVVDLVKPAIEKAGVTHLVLVGKLRHEARLKFADGYVGSGRLEGLGFYLDHQLLTEERGEGNVGRGFIAPYAYFRVSLVDLRSGEVVGQRDVLASQAVGAGRSPSLRVWEALSAEEKVKMITGLARREAAEAVREMLANR
jgi:hypothetical protein